MKYVIWLPEPGLFEMNLMLGSSCPTYHPLSMNRVALPFLTAIGSVQKAAEIRLDGLICAAPAVAVEFVDGVGRDAR